MASKYRNRITAAITAALVASSLMGCAAQASTKSSTAQTETDQASTQLADTEVVQEQASDAQETQAETSASNESAKEVVTTSLAGVVSDGVIDTTDLFTSRDLEQEADLTDARTLTLASGQDVLITEGGTYVLSGSAQDTTITVNVDETEKVQLVLDGVTITNADFPAIYVVSADKVFVTTAAGSENYLAVTGTFVADGDTNTDAVIFSKEDLVLSGLGTLTIESTDNAVTSKDDLKVTGGTYVVTSSSDSLEANDSIRIAGGTLTISSGKDAIHAENDEDDTVGYVYVCGGTINIDAADDGIQATTYVQIDGGTMAISAVEAIEGTYVQINGGDISVSASDDGINASQKSSAVTATLEIRGGNVAVSMAQGDTDALDSNGYIIVSGGNVDIVAQFAFDYDLGAEFTGGTIYVNGQQVTEITESMMMGGGMMGGPGEMGGGMMGGPGGGQGGW